MNKTRNRIEKYEQQISLLKRELEGYKISVAELNTLNEIAVSAGLAVNVDQMLSLIIKKTTNALNAEQGTIMLLNKEKGNLLKTFLREKEVTSSKQNLHIGTEITGWVLRHKEALIVEDLSRDERFDTKGIDCLNINSLLCIPIWFEGSIIGLLTMLNKKDQKSFTKDDFTLLSIISVQAAQLIKNIQFQNETSEKQKEAEKMFELDKIKTNFFTNISHELRTPLTLILGPAERICSETSDNIIKDADTIKRNSQRLLQLINQLLDLSKLEAGKMKLEASRGNIVPFVKGIALSFESLLQSKNIKFIINYEKENIELFFDKEKMIKILSNLIINSFKFTPEDGTISISINYKPSLTAENSKMQFVEIKIKDSGIGIDQEEISKLFDRFYQVDSSFTKEQQGSGIGLALVKELVELHNGSISVESKVGQWTEFTIYIPLGKEHLNKEEIAEEKETDVILHETKNLMTSYIEENGGKMNAYNDVKMGEDKTIILVVEDNYDMREYIKESLGIEYFVEEAINGEQGVRKAENLIPDLIISDIMMPKMDGNELVRVLKNDERTSHIPIIILTAKSGQESKLEGLETGADDYLTKPFDTKELQIKVRNLINIRKKLQEKFSRLTYLLTAQQDEKIMTMDEKFIFKVRSIIEKHISNQEFSVEHFADLMFMSRVQLHRKFIALINKSPGEFIRSFRLKRAAKLLMNKYGNISEVAYDVGFNTPSYFSEAFRKYYGCSPLEYYKTHQNSHTK
jgi:signal transduction histidine kinase/DNA-binding response OmpR family regulator